MAASHHSPRRSTQHERNVPDPRPRVLGPHGLGVECWLHSSWSWVTSRQLRKAGASWKKVELIFSPKEPNPHDPVLFLILVSGTEKEEPARYWIIHVGVINLTSLSRFAGTVPLSKVGDIEYLIYTSKQVLCSQTAGWTMLVSGRRFALLELQLDTNNEMRSCYV